MTAIRLQALALSLEGITQESTEAFHVVSSSSDRTEAGANVCAKNEKANMQGPAGRKKSRHMVCDSA